MARTALLNVMVNSVRKVARSLTRDFGEVEELQISRKGPQDFVTNCDIAIEKGLINLLQEARPGYGFVTEEGGIIEGSDKTHRWIIDPIDGTTNFMHGNPHCCISLALEREGQIHAGVIYNPITDELFEAEKKRGAYLNDVKLRVAGRNHIADSLINTGQAELHVNPEHYYKRLGRAHNRAQGLRISGSAALDLAYLAAGRIDAFWDNGIKIWDIAAGSLMVTEAGGQIYSLDGSACNLNEGQIAASNRDLKDQFVDLLKA